MGTYLKVVIGLILLVYPFLIFLGFKHTTPLLTNIFVIIILSLRLIFSKKKNNPIDKLTKYVLGIMIIICVFGIFIQTLELVKLYPVILNFSLLALFANSLRFTNTPVIELLARIREKHLNLKARGYVRLVTIVWMTFFGINGLASLYTYYFSTLEIWTLYNGFISYILIAVLFLVEFCVRFYFKKRWERDFTIEIQSNFYNQNCEINYTKEDLLKVINTLIHHLERNPQVKRVAINCTDTFYFSAIFLALCNCKVEVVILPNYQTKTLEDYDKYFDMVIDKNFVDKLSVELNQVGQRLNLLLDTGVTLFTSGSSGRPQLIRKKLSHLIWECQDLEEVFGKRLGTLFIGSISHQHIYGLLFRVLLPLITKRDIGNFIVEFPEQLKTLADVNRMDFVFVSSPAFLKRLEKAPQISNKDLFQIIFSSGGPLPAHAARSTYEFLGHWPWEVYGSTETGGMAYRSQSQDNIWWQPFPEIDLEIDHRGCLRVFSPFIDAGEFQTNDLVEQREDGKFKLAGRVDRTVKIEEKRLSLDHLEAVLKNNHNIRDAHCVEIDQDGRVVIGCLIVLEDQNEWINDSKIAKVKTLKAYLLQYFEAVLLPKKVRFLPELPYNAQSKLPRSTVLEYFNENERD